MAYFHRRTCASTTLSPWVVRVVRQCSSGSISSRWYTTYHNTTQISSQRTVRGSERKHGTSPKEYTLGTRVGEGEPRHIPNHQNHTLCITPTKLTTTLYRTYIGGDDQVESGQTAQILVPAPVQRVAVDLPPRVADDAAVEAEVVLQDGQHAGQVGQRRVRPQRRRAQAHQAAAYAQGALGEWVEIRGSYGPEGET